MVQSQYSALSALRVQQYNLDTIANNLSNVNTIAFQSGRVDFKDSLYRALQGVGTNQRMGGSGALIDSVQRMTFTGTPDMTGESLDMMLDGRGYFAVADGAGNVFFTRNGAFGTTLRNGTKYLTTASGLNVLGTNNQPIQINGNPENLTVGKDGVLKMDGAVIGKLRVVGFTNEEGLMDIGGSLFAYNNAAGAITASDAPVLQGALESSNVDVAEEMSRMMRAQKAYAFLGRIISTSDQMESQANNMIR